MGSSQGEKISESFGFRGEKEGACLGKVVFLMRGPVFFFLFFGFEYGFDCLGGMRWLMDGFR